MKRYIFGILTALIIGFFIGAYTHQEGELLSPVTSWQKLTSPGELSASHGFLNDDCGACHTAVKGPSAEKCMACHAADERLLVWPELQFHFAVPDCRRCHREHLGTGSIATGMDHNLIAETSVANLLQARAEQDVERPLSEAASRLSSDRINTLTGPLIASETALRCATCHFEGDRHNGMFGSQCSNCHDTQAWKILEYRHPSGTSLYCSQCHRAPPCHFTSHFEEVCAPVAGQLNAKVEDCYACHQIPSWNSIKGAGWYQSH